MSQKYFPTANTLVIASYKTTQPNSQTIRMRNSGSLQLLAITLVLATIGSHALIQQVQYTIYHITQWNHRYSYIGLVRQTFKQASVYSSGSRTAKFSAIRPAV